MGFNPRPCARGDLGIPGRLFEYDKFQSTPLREGRPGQVTTRSAEDVVSIHAPARGATVGRWNCTVRNYVSIHAPARGATFWSRNL